MLHQPHSDQEEKTSEKQKIILFNHVNEDGTGDFAHFLDIYKEFTTNPLYKDYEFIPVISCAKNQFDKIKKKFDALHIPGYLFEDGEEFVDAEMILKQAKQIFLISHNSFPLIREYEKYFNPEAPCKFIGEHDSEIYSQGKLGYNRLNPDHFPSEKWQAFCMGLDLPKQQGIKLKNIPRLPTDEVLERLGEDPSSTVFLDALLNNTETEEKTFSENNTLIPLYFNKLEPIEKFLYLASSQPDIVKNPCIYLSGFDLKSSDLVLDNLKNTGIRQIQIIRPGQEPEIIGCNESGDQIVRIFCGFNLGDDAYQLLHQQAPLAGASGDNSFEKLLSMVSLLPFYQSTNDAMKIQTISALCSLIYNFPDIPNSVVNDYCSYFKRVAHPDPADSLMLKLFCKIDLKKMIEHWPKIAEALKKSHNFYDRLQRIFFKDMPLPTPSAEELTKNDYFPLLCIAVENDDLDLVNFLLENTQIDPNRKNPDGFTLLEIAVNNKRLNVIRSLLKNEKIDATVKDARGRSLVYGTVISGNADVLKALIECPRVAFNEATKTEFSIYRAPLLEALNRGHFYMAICLIKHPKININIKDENGVTPLYSAAKKGSLSIVNMVLNHPSIIKDDLYVNEDIWNLPKNTQLDKLVLEKNIKEKIIITPLHIAVANNHLEIVKALLAHGLRCQQSQEGRITELELAIALGQQDMVDLLNGNLEHKPVMPIKELPVEHKKSFEQENVELKQEDPVSVFFTHYQPGQDSYWNEENKRSATLDAIVRHANGKNKKLLGGFSGKKTKQTLMQVFGVTKEELSGNQTLMIHDKIMGSAKHTLNASNTPKNPKK